MSRLNPTENCRRWIAASAVVASGLVLSSAASAQPAWPPPPEPLRLTQPMAGVPSGPRVLVRSDFEAVQLERSEGTVWKPVCDVPCELTGVPAGLYRVAGVGMRTSDPFRLQRSSGDTRVDVNGTSKAVHNAGIGCVIAGGPVILVGALYWGIVRGIASRGGPGQTYDPHEARVAWEGGLIFGTIGALLEAVGIPLFLAHTSVEVH